MPHWLQALLYAAGAIASWRWVLRPLRKTWRELLALLRQIRDASSGIQRLTVEIQALSGSVVHLATRILERQNEHESRLNDLAELYVDLVAVIARNRKRIDALERTNGNE